MKTNRGTPKTLDESIANGFQDLDIIASEKDIGMMKINVIDFLAQHFNVAFLEIENSQWDRIMSKLWKRVSG